MSNTNFMDFLHLFVQEYFYKESVKQLSKLSKARKFTLEETGEAKSQIKTMCDDAATKAVKVLTEKGIRTEEDFTKRSSEVSKIMENFALELMMAPNDDE